MPHCFPKFLSKKQKLKEKCSHAKDLSKNKHVTKERGNKYGMVGRLHVQTMVEEPKGDGGHGAKVA